MKQAQGIARALSEALEGARLMARNAEMERDLTRTGECDAPAFDASAQGKKYASASEAVSEVEKALSVLVLAAGYDPKQPLTAGGRNGS